MEQRKRSERFNSLADPLAGPLRREARLQRPEFSTALDMRLRAAIHATAAAARPASGSPRRFRARLLSWVMSAAAALAVLAVTAILCQSLGPSPGETVARSESAEFFEPAGPTADDLEATAAVVENAASDVGEWMATTVGDNQWAGLDRDAATAVAAVSAPLPFDLSAAIADE